MRPSHNLQLPPRIYPPFQQLYATLQESTPPSQNISPFSTTIILCDPFRIYPSLPEYNPLFSNYNIMRHSQYLTLLPRIYPSFQHIHMCDPPRIYPSFPDYTLLFNNYMRPSQNLPIPPRIYSPLFNNFMRPSQNLPLPPWIYPSFQQLYATLPESTPPSQNIPPFSKMHMCDPPRMYHSLPDYTLLFNNYMRFVIFVINWINTTSLSTLSCFNSFKYFFISDLTIQGSYKIVNYFIMYFFCVVIQYVGFVC